MRDVLIAAAMVFAIVAGANDGCSMLAGSWQVAAPRPTTAWLILVSAVALIPDLLGTHVAFTLAHGLVPFAGPGVQRAVLIAVSVAMLVVFGLTRVGVSTSLTLALIGAITGAGFGAGVRVDLLRVAVVLGLGLVAPVVAASLAYLLSRTALPALHAQKARRWLRHIHVATFGVQCVAYATNGAQKVLALMILANGGIVRRGAALSRLDVLLAAAPFGLGTLLGIRRVSSTLGRAVFAVRLRHAVVAEIVSTVLSLSAGLVGIPLTMSQSVTGALVGAGASEGARRVRWTVAGRFLGAWALTMPTSMGLAAALSAIAGRS